MRIACLTLCVALTTGTAIAQTTTPPSPDPITQDEIKAAGNALAAQLIDPDSMEIQMQAVRRVAKAAAFCGLVNAKNRFGGYVGYRPFVILGTNVTLSDGTSWQDSKVGEMQQLFCYKPLAAQ